MGEHFYEHIEFSIFVIALFFDIILRWLDPIFDEGREGLEYFEDQAKQGKLPFDHDAPLFLSSNKRRGGPS